MVLMEFIGLDLWLPLITDNPARPVAFRCSQVAEEMTRQDLRAGEEQLGPNQINSRSLPSEFPNLQTGR